MKENFQKALDFTLPHEGVYSNDPVDPGGETKWGISRKNHPSISAEDWADFSLDDAKEVYRRDYWDIMRCDALPWPLDVVAFDCSVNLGTGAARRILKKSEGNWRSMMQLRREHYAAIIRKNPKLAKYRKGWSNRCDDLEEFADA